MHLQACKEVFQGYYRQDEVRYMIYVIYINKLIEED